jgi:uncharacterized membrane protein
VQLQIIVAAFNDEDAADLALDELQMASADQGFTIQDAAVVRRSAEGVLHTNETNEWNKDAAAAGGSLAGGLIGLLGGPLGLAVGTFGGAVAGDVTVRVHNAKTPAMTSDELKPLEDVLRPNSSALVAVTGNQPADKVRDLLTKAGASNVRQTDLTADIADALAHHKDVAYAMAGTPGELDAVRMAANEAGAEFTGVITTDQDVYVGSAQVTDDSPDDSQEH